MSGLNMKAFIVTDNCLYDVNDKFLESGKYYFLIRSFTDQKTIIGDIIDNNKPNSQYEFRFFSFMTMIIKAQSYMSRRVTVDSLSSTLRNKGDHMPNYPSPKKVSRKKLNYIRKMNSPLQCMICLNETSRYDFSLKKLSCGHEFHLSCVNEWLQHSSSCPICRKSISTRREEYNF